MCFFYLNDWFRTIVKFQTIKLERMRAMSEDRVEGPPVARTGHPWEELRIHVKKSMNTQVKCGVWGRCQRGECSDPWQWRAPTSDIWQYRRGVITAWEICDSRKYDCKCDWFRTLFYVYEMKLRTSFIISFVLKLGHDVISTNLETLERNIREG